MYMGKGAGSAPSAPPPYDFEDLESRFQIHKYIPKYFHNYDYSTPVIKDLIADKPIYAKANQHVKCCVSGGEKKSKRQLHKEYKEEKRDMRQEKKLLHKEYKHEKKELKKDYRSARRESRKVSRNHEGAEGDSGGAEVKYFKSWDKPLAEPKPFKITEGRYPDEAVNFQNPFLPVPEKAEIPQQQFQQQPEQ